jgi:cellulose synthase/poly-beta-1,6-N-acetylglucosamine synthase-like glycosyltransferase
MRQMNKFQVAHGRSVRATGGGRPEVDGKFLRVDGERFYVRGVTYGTFAETELGLFPELKQVEEDFAAMAAVGMNTVRTYTVPGLEILDLAQAAGLKLLMGVWWDDPRYLDPTDRGSWQKMTAGARAAVKEAVESYASHPAVLGFVLGNEIPGPVVRWHGRRRIEALLRNLYETGKDAAPEALFSYANFPTTQYLDTSYFDFDCFNVFLENESAYRRYLAQLQVSTGDRPLLLTELGLDSGGGEDRQADCLDWQMRGAMELGLAGTCVFSWTDDWWVGRHKVEGWYFGVTRENREPKPALNVLEGYYRKRPSELREVWPRVSVVVCAYQAQDTIEECLWSLTELEYPNYEVLVVDDGSTDATAQIAHRFPVRLLSRERLGLSGARNVGLEHAQGEFVAYIDADAKADPDWLTYLALALEVPGTAGAGGPNPVPPDDPPVAQCVARAPGGPIHVLLDDERAEHVPGCNMAFWRETLLEIGGFDPIYTAAGDDVDVCWKLLGRGYDIRFHPSALVWHRRRDSVRAFWRQQLGYGRAEALVERNHPDKFNSLGQATWRGVIYGPRSILPGRERVYAGRFGDAPFQKIYNWQNPFHPLWALYPLLFLCLLALLNPYMLVLPGIGLATLTGIYVWRGMAIGRRERLRPLWRLGPLLGLLYFLPSLARAWGRLSVRWPHASPSAGPASWQLRSAGGGTFLTEHVEEVGRTASLEGLRHRLQTNRLHPKASSEWDEADIICSSALFWRVRMVSYEAWGTLYVRLAYRPRLGRLAVSALGIALALLLHPFAAAVVIGGLLAILLLEGWIFARKVRRALTEDPKVSSHG